MIDNTVRLANGMNFDKFHKEHFHDFTGFPSYHNTNIDKVCKFLDIWPFMAAKDYEEQDKAYDINYAHGMELDDEFGDPYGIDRNGLDDIQYRFILQCHRLAVECNGTLPQLIHFVSSCLQCSDKDVTLGMARHYSSTGQLVGEPDTIDIKNINIENVPYDQLIPLLSNQLQLAVAADKRVEDIEFYTNINTTEYVGTEVTMHAKITIPIPDIIHEGISINTNENVGTDVRMTGRIKFNTNK